MAKFEIDVSLAGKGSVVVNDTDLSNDTEALALFSKAGEPTTLQLFTHASGIAKGEGIVEIHVDNKEGLASWLRQVNRGTVDAAAMSRGQWGDGSTLTDNVIDTLLEMLDATELSPDS